jgi:SH3-like domain-containing protein
VEIEEALLLDVEKKLVAPIRSSESHEAYVSRMLMLSGRREAIRAIWSERDLAMKKIVQEESEKEKSNE